MERVADEAPAVCICDPARDKLALALAAQGWPQAERAVQWQAIGELIREGRGGELVLLAARQGARLLGAILAQSLAGKTAMVWPPQFAAGDFDEHQSLAALLFGELFRELPALGVHLAQALLPVDDERGRFMLGWGGFIHAADMLYMTAPADDPAADGVNLPFELEDYTAASAERLTGLIDRTYVETLDCPLMDNLRQTRDVLDGYRAVGEFRPQLWKIVSRGGEDVGCLLVNLHPDVKAAEIVYLGLVPEVRGRGWGRLLTLEAKRLAQNFGCEQIVLGVDATNQPAVRLYEAAGFGVCGRKEVWLRPLR